MKRFVLKLKHKLLEVLLYNSATWPMKIGKYLNRDKVATVPSEWFAPVDINLSYLNCGLPSLLNTLLSFFLKVVTDIISQNSKVVHCNFHKKLSYRRETARQLHTTTWAGQLTF